MNGVRYGVDHAVADGQVNPYHWWRVGSDLCVVCGYPYDGRYEKAIQEMKREIAREAAEALLAGERLDL